MCHVAVACFPVLLLLLGDHSGPRTVVSAAAPGTTIDEGRRKLSDPSEKANPPLAIAAMAQVKTVQSTLGAGSLRAQCGRRGSAAGMEAIRDCTLGLVLPVLPVR